MHFILFFKIASSYFLELHSLDLQIKFLKIREVMQLAQEYRADIVALSNIASCQLIILDNKKYIVLNHYGNGESF